MIILNERLPSKLELIMEYITRAVDKIRSLPFSEEEIFKIRLALWEALINAMKHGNKLNPNLSVEIKIDIIEDRVILEILDEGQGFDFRNLPDPTKEENLLKTSGRGVFLIKNLMDKVDFFSNGRGVKMIKFVKSQKEVGGEYKRGKA